MNVVGCSPTEKLNDLQHVVLKTLLEPINSYMRDFIVPAVVECSNPCCEWFPGFKWAAQEFEIFFSFNFVYQFNRDFISIY